ncbi:MAG: amidohydrolase [Parvibaculales bacterium]
MTRAFFSIYFAVFLIPVLAAWSPSARAETDKVIYPAAEIVTLSAHQGDAVLVRDGRIAAVGALDALRRTHPQARIDDRYAGQVMVPGLIEHHVHPFLAALSMSAHVLAIEDWALPHGRFPGVRTAAGYRSKLTAALAAINADAPPDAPFVSWGYHHYFHGKLTRRDLDKMAPDRPVLIVHRSFHELIFNTAALELAGITQADIDAAPASARQHMSLADGHFAEQGTLAVSDKAMVLMAPPRKLMLGLARTRAYLHARGVTLAANPGAMLSPALQQAKNAVFGAPDAPFRSLFIPNGMMLAAQTPGQLDTLVARTRALETAGAGRLSYVPGQVKLFADGAMYSQAMQMRDGYLDGHKGAWMMEPEVFRAAFRIYWEAGYQIHVHQNGDAGLDLVLDTLAENLARMPRPDHRTVLVHFGYAAADQVDRLRKLGALVSANPYYVTALSHLYAEKGVGAARAPDMARLGDVVRAGVRLGLHSDMPMAPGDPLFLMHQAVNRVNFAGDIAAPEQRLTPEQALRAVTLDAAYMMRLEADYGSLAPGKRANITVLAQNPLTAPPATIKDIPVIATMVEGVSFPVE